MIECIPQAGAPPAPPLYRTATDRELPLPTGYIARPASTSWMDAAPAANESPELLVLLETLVVIAANPPRVAGLFEPFVSQHRSEPSGR
jgi:hypothetical protein